MAKRFSVSITKFVKETNSSADRVLKRVGLEAYKLVLLNSAVDTSRFRGSHNIGVNTVDKDAPKKPNPRSLGTSHASLMTSGERSYADQKLSRVKFGDTITVSNSQPYARKLENQGHSKQTPLGTYGPAFDQLRASVDTILRAGIKI